MKLVDVFERIGLVEISDEPKLAKQQESRERPAPETIDQIVEEDIGAVAEAGAPPRNSFAPGRRFRRDRGEPAV